MRKHIANIITLSRLIGSITLLSFVMPSKEFIIVYTYCGLTDAFDGFVARKLKIESKLGSLLDSVSDLTFYSIMLYKIWPLLRETLPSFVFTIIWGIFGIRAACYIFVMLRDKHFASEHFILNKITSFLLFFLPYIIKTKFFIYYAIVLLTVATIAALYEFNYHLNKK